MFSVAAFLTAPYVKETSDIAPHKLVVRDATSIIVVLRNPFNDRNGPMVAFALYVSTSTSKPYNTHLIGKESSHSARLHKKPFRALGLTSCVNQTEELKRKYEDFCCSNNNDEKSYCNFKQNPDIRVIIGEDKDCDEGHKKQQRTCNGPLQPNTTYYFAVEGCTSTSCSIGPFSEKVSIGLSASWLQTI